MSAARCARAVLQDSPDWQLVSRCSAMEHEVQQQFQHEVIHTLDLDLAAARKSESWESAFHSLPAAAESSTRWRVQFQRYSSDMRIDLRCDSVDEQLFSGAAARLFATVESDPSNWVDCSAVWRRGGWWRGLFPKRVSDWGEVSRTRVRVRVRWSDVARLVDAPSLGALRIRCRWRLHGWNTVHPTADWWELHSDPFHCGGSWWGMRVGNVTNGDGSRQLLGVVALLHLPAVDAARLEWHCTLAHNGTLLPEQNRDMREGSYCRWPLFGNVESATCDPLELVVDITVTVKS